MLFWVKTVFLGQEMHYYMIYIAYHTESNLQMLQLRAKDAFVSKIVNTRLTNFFLAIFALAERLPTSATLHVGKQISVNTMYHHVFEMIIIDNCLMREAVETVGGGASLASTTDRGTRSPPVRVDRWEAEDLALIVGKNSTICTKIV